MKKTNTLRDTLSKKKELPIKEKRAKSIEKEVTNIHAPKKASEVYFRTTVYLPKQLHKELKVFVAQNEGLSLKEFITEAVQEKLNRSN
ncbi:ribbon-helix-helix domain-containing protein [Marinilabilia rubra]|uniref:CopG family transcriptional regulator n=1 Tax=Marinilabilia rubra TaxID=2162893 RepID=A0A2U2BAD2_9BACT|nr:hypothetical protein [Marinilabilia rubra]PWE00024.1 hypothetical protein DDZ16_06575 [Marinilabilia rubra]